MTAINELSFSDLQLMGAAAETRSISALAFRHGLTQPALSRRITLIEARMGGAIFRRSRRGLVPTRFGQECLAAIRELESSFHLFTQRVGQLGNRKLVLRIGCYDSFAVYCIPRFLKEAVRKFPKTSFELALERSSVLINKFKNNELDIAIVFLQGLIDPSLRAHSIGADHYGFFESSVLGANKNLVSLFSSKGDNGVSIEQSLDSFSLRTTARIDCPSFEIAKECTRAGLGVGILPFRVANPLVLSGEIRTARVKGAPLRFGRHEISLLAGRSVEPTLSKTLVAVFRSLL